MNIQQPLSNEYVKMLPLKESDFDALYLAASDPNVWAQHPNPNRYQKADFEKYFEGAVLSKGAYTVYDAITNDVIGCTRFYDLDMEKKEVAIGYTFVVCSHWGKPYNRSMKKLMIDQALQFVNRIILHIGAENIRSKKAAAKIGAKKFDEVMMNYYGEGQKLNFLYEIKHAISL